MPEPEKFRTRTWGACLALSRSAAFGQIELDHLGRARADEEQLPDVGAARDQAIDLAVEFVLCVRKPGQILFLEDGRAEARFGEDHHAGG